MSEGIDDHGIRKDYPLMAENAERHDFAERLGGSTSPLLREIDAALREIWDSRRQLHDCKQRHREQLEAKRGGVGYPDP